MPRPRKWYPAGHTIVVDKRGRLRTRQERYSVDEVRAWMRKQRTIDYNQQEQTGSVSTQQHEERDTFHTWLAVKRGSIQDLRDKVMAKMTKIAKSQLGLSQFPYERARKGEVIIHGIPPSLMPLQPPERLSTKDLRQILDCEVTVTRAPSVPLHNTSTHTNSTLDISQPTRLLEHNLQMSHLINTTETCDGRTPSHATEGQFQSQLITDKQNQPDDRTNTISPEVPLKELPKAKRTRVTWDATTVKALENSLGPLGAVDHIPSSTEIEKIRQNNPVLAKFDINQIYQKIYKSRMKRK